ncbi:TetR/AcrR family transcriptional regulator [Propionibacterium freudenreichii]|uniref:TetR/AcrR family transcriptional regulator n=1 Tax=Propionibacterium freudenreichii TaxID=1744 RepID=UPI0005431DC7|nr:TetR/AcrR family transcriptional regulator [Propionibacterium freudenreichii]MDK9348142.1 TetR/AcrR family transcriptional regulator [Propionibacterium freudenreichii]MDK9626972.1 TetR/AcrR family transcriptional regulator [Propionibacterium freudenreichii]MDK9652321.1 TetR/AcrR family transcriptional regulator [Propionibacterium freudenreichii]WFF31096.1 TetR/AcrR family transcriptional regulator [Propionibacterium freudenreichii]CEH01028.1 Transcriptional regulator, TetR/AcrR family [Prop
MTTYDATGMLIISVAIREIRRVGYRNLSLRELAARAGMTTGALYRRFSGKDELLAAAAASVGQQIAEEAQARMACLTPTPHERLVLLGEVMLNRFEKDRELMDFLFSALPVGRFWQGVTRPDRSSPLLALTLDTLDALFGDSVDHERQRELFVKASAFMQGYGLLIASGAVPYERQIFASAVTAFAQQAGALEVADAVKELYVQQPA